MPTAKGAPHPTLSRSRLVASFGSRRLITGLALVLQLACSTEPEKKGAVEATGGVTTGGTDSASGGTSGAAPEGGTSGGGASAIGPVCEDVSADLATLGTEAWMVRAGTTSATSSAPTQHGCTPMAAGGFICEGSAVWSLEEELRVLTFEDGSQLEWSALRAPDGATPPASPPEPEVWMKFERKVTIVCPYCGSFSEDWLELRDAAEGQLLWYAVRARSFADEQFSALFGVPATSKPKCVAPADGSRDCYEAVVRQVYNHEVATDPPALLPFDTTSEIDAPSGRFEITWLQTAVVSATRTPNCADGVPPIDTVRFQARRIQK